MNSIAVPSRRSAGQSGHSCASRPAIRPRRARDQSRRSAPIRGSRNALTSSSAASLRLRSPATMSGTRVRSASTAAAVSGAASSASTTGSTIISVARRATATCSPGSPLK